MKKTEKEKEEKPFEVCTGTKLKYVHAVHASSLDVLKQTQINTDVGEGRDLQDWFERF